MSLSTDDKVAVFRNDKTPLFESMTAFTKSSSGIFSFYRELASEMVEISSLQSVSLYSDYETQIAVLQRLWERYLELIHAAGFTDEWESYRSPSFRDEFISRYDEFIFLIGGYLTKYELEQLRKVGQILPVTLLFNYSGAKSSHHKIYEKVLDIKLDDRPAPTINLHNARLYACTGMLA